MADMQLEIKMDKPKKKVREYYDYHECSKFLEEKYKYQERDYLGRWSFQRECVDAVNKKYGKSWYNKSASMFDEQERKASDEYDKLMESQPEYKDFWHWVVDRYEVHNGGKITFTEGYADKEEEFIKTIYNYYMTEFGEDGELTMETSW